MKKEELYEILGDMDEQLIAEAQKLPERKKKKWFIPAVACAGVIGGIMLYGFMMNGKISSPEGTVLAAVEYPVMPQYPAEYNVNDDYEMYQKQHEAWFEARRDLVYTKELNSKYFMDFVKNSMQVFVSDNDENIVYSPMSLYMALGMSAEITEGDTRQQILDALGYRDIETLRTAAGKVWGANYMDDGMAKCLLATSIWTNNAYSYNKKVLDVLANDYYVSAYTGSPDNPKYSSLLQEWINTQTDGMLENYVSGIEFNPEMVLTLASTVNYNGKWKDAFIKEDTKEATFHAPDKDIICDFMNETLYNGTYYWGENFGAITKRMENNGELRVILPDEGNTIGDLLSDEEALSFIADKNNYTNECVKKINLSLPKFDISSSIDLNSGLKELGITDIFDSNKADFTPLVNDSQEIALSSANQSARISIDEEGCKASALTIMMYTGAAPPSEETIDFVVDRPFIFEIVSENGYPLFLGVVNNPV